jgi:hypothetical protein
MKEKMTGENRTHKNCSFLHCCMQPTFDSAFGILFIHNFNHDNDDDDDGDDTGCKLHTIQCNVNFGTLITCLIN